MGLFFYIHFKGVGYFDFYYTYLCPLREENDNIPPSLRMALMAPTVL